MQTITLQRIKQAQLHKKRLFEREVCWIKREFKDFHTMDDIDLYNADAIALLQLGAYWI